MDEKKVLTPTDVLTSLNHGHVVTAQDLILRGTNVAAKLLGWAVMVLQWVCALALVLAAIMYVLHKFFGWDRAGQRAIHIGMAAVIGLVFVQMVPYILGWILSLAG